MAEWEDLLVVANCKIHWKDFAQQMIYVCPATNEGFHAKHTHMRAKYFAPFVSEGAKYVANIDAVVRVTSETDGEIVWNNSETSEQDLIAKALEKRQTSTACKPPCLVFLLSGGKSTDLVFDNRGTLLAGQQYFDISSLGVSNTAELATKLRDVPWSNLVKYKPE